MAENTFEKDLDKVLAGILNNDFSAVADFTKKAKETAAPAKENEPEKTAGPDVVYEHGMIIEVDGKKVAKGPNGKKGKHTGVKKNDPIKDTIKTLYTTAIKESTFGDKSFPHSTEGLIVRLPEADYSIKVSHTKAPKIDAAAADFKLEKDFSTRGKVKNSAPTIARMLDKTFTETFTEHNLTVVDVRATAITLHTGTEEYVVKISKKRDRVGFEAEKGESYV